MYIIHHILTSKKYNMSDINVIILPIISWYKSNNHDINL